MVSAKLLSLSSLAAGLFSLPAQAYLTKSGDVNLGKAERMLPTRSEHLYPHLKKRADDLSKLDLQDEMQLTWTYPNSINSPYFLRISASTNRFYRGRFHDCG